MNLHNETLVNVAALLQEPVGSLRQYDASIDVLDLGDDLQALDIAGALILTRLSNEILATMTGTYMITLECQRCLEQFENTGTFQLTESFIVLPEESIESPAEFSEGEEENPLVSAAHEIDLGESIRQEILVAMPMRPVCQPDCEGLFEEVQTEEDTTDSRFAALSQLLHE